MTFGFRAVAVALSVMVTSYGVLGAGGQLAGAAEVGPPQNASTLPGGTVGDLVVDDPHQKVFVSMSSAGSVVVANHAGEVIDTVTGLTYPGGMTLSGDAATLYVAEGDVSSLVAIDTATHGLRRHALPDGTCPRSVTFTGGKVWYSYVSCTDPNAGGVGVFDPATGEATSGVFTALPGEIRALPDRPDRLVLLEANGGKLHVYDVSTSSPSVVAEGRSAGDLCVDLALISGGTYLVTTCRSSQSDLVYTTSDLSLVQPLTYTGTHVALAVTPDHRFLVGAGHNSLGTTHLVNGVEYFPPGGYVGRVDVSASDVMPGALGFAASRTLFGVYHNRAARQNQLMWFPDATKKQSAVSFGPISPLVEHGDPIRISGLLTATLGSGNTLAVSREDRNGVTELDPVPVLESRAFTFTDTPPALGPVTYTFRYQGNDEYAGSKALATTRVVPKPYDLNGDHHAEVVVGAPRENIGSIRDAGMFHVLPGGSSGATGLGSVAIDQNTPGVPGTAEAGDGFGYASASGDFNGDDFPDVAVSAPFEDVAGFVDGGAVWIFYGSAQGIRTDNVRTLSMFAGDLSWSRAQFGRSLAAGDFTGDSLDDLAIGAPGARGGGVVVVPGASDPAIPIRWTFTQNSPGVPGTDNTGDQFGWSLAAADIDGDGRSDLAIGAPGDAEDRGWATGSVTVLYGAFDSSARLPQRLTKDSPRVPGGSGSFDLSKDDSPDRFGHRVALGDFNGDTLSDLAVGAPGSPVSVDGVRKRDAGTVTVLYSHGIIDGWDGLQISQQVAGIPGVAGQEDRFGATLAAGYTDADRSAELTSYSPGDGYVTVVPGSTTGLVYGNASAWTQNSTGIPGTTEPGDRWGNSLRFVSVKGAGRSLVVGADGENSGAGSCTVIHSTSAGLTGTGAQYFSQDVAGVPGSEESGDGFGSF